MSVGADKFASPSEAETLRLVNEHPLAWIISPLANDCRATVLPIRPIADAGGRLVRLEGHFARSNRHVEVLKHNPRALILFMGPQGYVSPSWMRDRTQAPTWNYASAQCVVDIEFNESAEKLGEHLNDLVGAMEAGRTQAWNVREMGARYDSLAKRVIGFEAVIVEQRTKFKLGQDERDDVFADILSALATSGEHELHEWMARSNSQRVTAS